jgi:hypothetical protein
MSEVSIFLKQGKHHRKSSICAGVVLSVVTICGVVLIGEGIGKSLKEVSEEYVVATPWHSVGGCGVGGGSVSGGASVRWVGRGVPGALVDMEARYSRSLSSAVGGGMLLRRTHTIPVTLGFHPTVLDMTLQLPLQYKEEIIADESDEYEKAAIPVSGIGDFSLSFSRALGMSGQTHLNVGLTLPTGKADIYGFTHRLLVSDMQTGSGVMGVNAGFEHTLNFGWGVVMLGGSYSTGLLYMHTTDAIWDYDLERAESEKKKLEWAHDGAVSYVNDKGVRRSDNIGLHFYAGIKQDNMMHSFGVLPSYPLTALPFVEESGEYVEYETVNRFFFSPGFNGTGPSPDKSQILESLHDSVETSDIYESPGDSVTYVVHKADTEWVAEKRVTRTDKEHVTFTMSYGLELSDIGLPFPLFLSLSAPLVFDFENGVGVSGFSAGMGVKYMLW